MNQNDVGVFIVNFERRRQPGDWVGNRKAAKLQLRLVKANSGNLLIQH